MKKNMNYVKLNNGVEMPQLGFGTYLIPDEVLERTLIKAYDMGYRQFDTAWKYGNEAAIARCFKKHGIRRKDIFLTTKLSAHALYRGGYKYGPRRILNRRNGVTIGQAVQQSFDNLGTNYIDLFLIHAPFPEFIAMWKVLEQLYRQGRIRAIGVSNFLQPHIEYLCEVCEIVPTVNQLEISPLNAQIEYTQWLQAKGIAVEAHSTFSHTHSVEPRMEIIGNPGIVEVAKAHGKSSVQVVLRWLVQRGIICIPKTWHEPHIKENISVFDFELSPEEMDAVTSLDKGKFLNYNNFNAQRMLPRKYRDWEGFKNPDNFPDLFNAMPWWKKQMFIY